MTGGDREVSPGGSPDIARLQAASTDQLRELVATLWQSSGWEVDTSVRVDTLLATRSADAGDSRRLLRVRTGETAATALFIRETVELMRTQSATGAVAVSVAGFEDGAVATANAYGVDLVGPRALAVDLSAVDEEFADDSDL